MNRPASAGILVLGSLIVATQCRQAPEKSPGVARSDQDTTRSDTARLEGTSWRLVKFQGGDETTVKPDDPNKYTVTFEPGGRLRVRIDCNRGTGTWKSSRPPQLEFGPLALTRAMCPPGSLHDQIAKRWSYVRSYVMKDGHLFLSMMADGGIFEFEPLASGGNTTDTVRGTATFRERMALPTGAVLESTLENVSRADAAAEVIGRARVEKPGNPPIRFEIPYDPSRIDSSGRYVVRARILVDGKPLCTTDQTYPVLTGGKGAEVQLMLRNVSASRAATAPLENTYWKLTRLADTPVNWKSARQREPHLILNSVTGRVGGSGGCNAFGGSYRLDGDRLSLGPVTSTMMACTEGMETERAFLQTLRRVNGWRIRGKELDLLDNVGNVVAHFQAVHLE